jgi:hypothetical protein
VKDLRHLHYDGTPLFSAPERPAGRRKQTVAERARNVRARVLPLAPAVLHEDEPDEIEDDFDAFADDAPEPEGSEEQLEATTFSTGAFAAMESEAPPEVEAAPVRVRDSLPD